MIKHYCDVCHKELERDYISERLKPVKSYLIKNKDNTEEKIIVEADIKILIHTDENSNSRDSREGELCINCLNDLITTFNYEEVEPKYILR
jgi:hypothetical protein